MISADPERKREAENEGNSEACDLEADGDGGGSPLPGMATKPFSLFYLVKSNSSRGKPSFKD